MTTGNEQNTNKELGGLINDKKQPKINTYWILALLLISILCIPAVGWLGRIFKGTAGTLNTLALPILALVIIALFVILVLRLFKRLIA